MNEKQEAALEYIKSQLEDGYLDLGLHDQDELQIIKEAIELYESYSKTVLFAHFDEEEIKNIAEELNKIGCTSFRMDLL